MTAKQISTINASYQQHDPDTEHDDLFLCHNCYEEANTDKDSSSLEAISLKQSEAEQHFPNTIHFSNAK